MRATLLVIVAALVSSISTVAASSATATPNLKVRVAAPVICSGDMPCDPPVKTSLLVLSRAGAMPIRVRVKAPARSGCTFTSVSTRACGQSVMSTAPVSQSCAFRVRVSRPSDRASCLSRYPDRASWIPASSSGRGLSRRRRRRPCRQRASARRRGSSSGRAGRRTPSRIRGPRPARGASGTRRDGPSGRSRRACADGCRYWPIVTTSTPCARSSRIVSTISSFDSPRPAMMPVFVSTG